MERRHGYGYRREIYERAADRVPRDGRQVETEKKVEKEKPKKNSWKKKRFTKKRHSRTLAIIKKMRERLKQQQEEDT